MASRLTGRVQGRGGLPTPLSPDLPPHLNPSPHTSSPPPQVGIKVVRLDGSMSLDARDRVINQFTNDPEVGGRRAEEEGRVWTRGRRGKA